MTTTNTERPPKLKVRIIGRNRTPLRKTPAPMASTLARRCRQPMRPLPSMDGPATMTARRAADALTRALLTMAARGERTRPHQLWLSEHEAERAEAVKLCRGCPVIQPCHQAAEEREERWAPGAGSTAASDQEEKTQHDPNTTSDHYRVTVSIAGQSKERCICLFHYWPRMVNIKQPPDTGQQAYAAQLTLRCLLT